MAIKIFEVWGNKGKKWGPKKLRELFDKIESAINDRTPRAGMGIEIDENPDGLQISTATATAGGGQDEGGGGGGGSSIDVYGAFNGAPAAFHLLQSRAPTVPPP